MYRAVLSLWEKPLYILLAVGIGLVVFFSVRVFEAKSRFHEPPKVRGFMTVPFVAEAHGVPVSYLFERIGIQDTQENRKLTIRELNERYFSNEQFLVGSELDVAVEDYKRSSQP